MRADTAGRLLRLTAALLAAPPPHAPHKGSDIDSPSLTVKALRVVRMKERGLFFSLYFFYFRRQPEGRRIGCYRLFFLLVNTCRNAENRVEGLARDPDERVPFRSSPRLDV